MNAEWWRAITIFVLGIFIGFMISQEPRGREKVEEEETDEHQDHEN